jgi:hypothetical protein
MWICDIDVDRSLPKGINTIAPLQLISTVPDVILWYLHTASTMVAIEYNPANSLQYALALVGWVSRSSA